MRRRTGGGLELGHGKSLQRQGPLENAWGRGAHGGRRANRRHLGRERKGRDGNARGERSSNNSKGA
eukprot:2132210-Prorocentrum_lima.AAC.1